MSNYHYGRRKDKNHGEIKKALIQFGCSIIESEEIDLQAGYKGFNFFFEVKNPERKNHKNRLRPRQEELLKTWQGQYDIIESFEDAVKIINKRVIDY